MQYKANWRRHEANSGQFDSNVRQVGRTLNRFDLTIFQRNRDALLQVMHGD
ncbi:hypothetical protein CA54_05990 [Symmachiella macrocystis]|uniref:Uncharacterized protein n=1 Tax=Symmachiella macrocystis TaxID=2527985 RepID=A0A5C6BI97_9PLAN|nr:hypothetical protein CA54_05990 [Symmachiella macrocystis]